LQFFGHEDGRARVLNVGGLSSVVYDYMLKDHLGNVRMVLTEEQKVNPYPAATLENEMVTDPATNVSNTAVSVENQYYNIDASKIVTNPANITVYQNNNGNPPWNNNPYSNATANSNKVYKTNASSNKIGLGITIKVMSGDQVNIFGKSYHKKPSGGYTNAPITNTVLDILNNLVTTSTLGAKGITGTQLESSFPSLTSSVFVNQPNLISNVPKASINWIILDEQFKFISGGFDMVGTEGIVKNHGLSTIPTINIPKNGYLYCSNESNYDVFFDNLQLIHTPSVILEETHYYPFGLTMAGISSKAAGMTPNKTKYQQYELNTDFDINLYESFYRSHDPQLGRFWQIGPKPNDSESPYVAMGNNPIRNVDVLGDTTWGYSNNGALYITICDNKANQIHFMDFDIPFPSASDGNYLIKGDEANSFAFVGVRSPLLVWL
jgi:RHS repeat-associated protein